MGLVREKYNDFCNTKERKKERKKKERKKERKKESKKEYFIFLII